MVAVLNNGGGFYSAAHYIHEARMKGAIIELPCINKSNHPNSVIDTSIYLGFGYLKSLEYLVIKRFLTERQLYGEFTSLDNFIERVVISIEQLTILIRIDGFRFTGKSKTQLLWQAIFKLNATKQKTKQAQLFKIEHIKYELPKLASHWIEDVYDEMELLGFTIHDYFTLVAAPYLPSIKAREMLAYTNENVLIYGLLVTTRYNKTSQGKLMRLSTFVDQEGYYFDAVHFTDVLDLYPINGIGIYACYGKITNRYDFCSMHIITSKKMGIVVDPRC